MRRYIIAIVAIVLAAGTRASGEPVNAADLYLEAGRALPESQGREERHVLLDVLSTPMNAAADALLQRGGTALELFDRASVATECQWPPPKRPSAGVQMVLHASDLAELVVLRARSRAQRGEAAGALQDCLRLTYMARRIGRVPAAVRQTQETVIFSKGVLTAGIVAPLVPAAELKGFVEAMENLPPATEPADVVAAEKQPFLTVHRRFVEDPKVREMAEAVSGAMSELVGVDAPGQLPRVDDLVDDPAKREATFTAVEKLFDDMAAVLRLPPGQEQDGRWRELEQRARALHPIAQSAAAVGGAARHLRRSQQINTLLLRKAVEIHLAQREQRDDASAAQAAAPYEYRPRPAGFELWYTPPGAKHPYVMTIGPHDPFTWDEPE